MSEVWKEIPGYEGCYEVSTHGRIRTVLGRLVKDKWGHVKPSPVRYLKQSNDSDGYKIVKLITLDNKRIKKVHRLVCLAFIGPPPEGMIVCHNDGNPSNNDISNLRYDTPGSNMLDKVKHGTHHEVNKTHCPMEHELKGNNLEAWNLKQGKRKCRSCSNARRYMIDHPDKGLDLQALSDQYYNRYINEGS